MTDSNVSGSCGIRGKCVNHFELFPPPSICSILTWGREWFQDTWPPQPMLNVVSVRSQAADLSSFLVLPKQALTEICSTNTTLEKDPDGSKEQELNFIPP